MGGEYIIIVEEGHPFRPVSVMCTSSVFIPDLTVETGIVIVGPAITGGIISCFLQKSRIGLERFRYPESAAHMLCPRSDCRNPQDPGTPHDRAHRCIGKAVDIPESLPRQLIQVWSLCNFVTVTPDIGAVVFAVDP